jgi:hypothetical protein
MCEVERDKIICEREEIMGVREGDMCKKERYIYIYIYICIV